MLMRFNFVVTIVLLACLIRAGEDLSPWGISTSSSGLKDAEAWFPKMHEAGLGSVRFFPEWNGVERKKGAWNWARTDALVNAAVENKLRVTAVMMGSVPWSKDKPHTFPMSDLDGWSEFIGQSVARYKDRIHHWEIWNEGNGGFNGGHHTAADYANLVSVAYAAAKKADPNALVGMTTASFDPAYLHQAILAQKKDGGAASFDYLCVHPYEIADGIGRPDGEVPYLWMSRTLRTLLKESAPEKANADLWITEIGRDISRRKDQAAAEREAAATFVKLYVMAAAQGIRCIQWFEGRDPAGEQPGFGLLKRDGSPRATYQACKTMTGMLGSTPKYVGCVHNTLGVGGGFGGAGDGDTFGFVFQNEAEAVLVAWQSGIGTNRTWPIPSNIRSRAGEVTFEKTVKSKTLSGEVKEGKSVSLNDEPIFVSGISEAVVADAKANSTKDFPWGGDFSQKKAVSTDGGVCQVGERLPKVTFPDGSSGMLVGANQSVSFYVHPSFASPLTREYHVRITVRRVTPGNVGMNLFYEIADTQGKAPYKNVGQWFSVNKEEGWQSFVWHVKDACFAKMWGYDISFRPEQSQVFVIGKVEVSTEGF